MVLQMGRIYFVCLFMFWAVGWKKKQQFKDVSLDSSQVLDITNLENNRQINLT